MSGQSLRAFAEWLIRMDDPGSVARQTVTLTRIIERAKDALAAESPIPPVEEGGGSDASRLGVVTGNRAGGTVSDPPCKYCGVMGAHTADCPVIS